MEESPLTGDPLLSLGLVDPRGNAVPTSDWSGPESNPPAESNGSNDGEQAQPTQTSTQPTTGSIDWESSSNPYKPDPVRQSQYTYAAQVDQLQREVPVAVQALVAQGWNQQAAESLVGTMFQTGVANARNAADRIAMLPYAKQMTAEQIVGEFSTSNVKIDPKELIDEPTVDAMKAKARTIVSERRDRVVNGRAASGADRVERAGGSASVDYSQLSPHAMISLGIRRGQ